MRKEKREEIRREERRDGGDEQRRGDESRVVNAKMREESFRIEPPLRRIFHADSRDRCDTLERTFI